MNETQVRHFHSNPLWRSIDEKLKGVNINVVEVYDFDLVTKFVSDKMGFAIVPELSIGNYEERRICVKPFHSLDELSLDLFAVYKRDSVHDYDLHHAILSAIEKMKSLVNNQLLLERGEIERI